MKIMKIHSNGVFMISLNDVEKVFVSSSCAQSWPCQHSSTVTLKDGRSVSNLTSFEICSIVSNIAKDRINPGKKWNAESVINHFRDYSKSRPKMGWIAESPEAVLNRNFSGQ